MLAVEIEDIKRFMGKLLLEEVFDGLVLVQAEIKMAVTFSIDGRINRSFLNTEEEEEHGEFTGWGEIRPQIMNIIKGKRLPVKMKIMLAGKGSGEVAYSLNILYENAGLRLITNASMKSFSLDRPDSSEWEEEIISLLKNNQIAYSVINS